MDPNACLAEIAYALRQADELVANQHSHDLQSWLRRGGFAPDWNKQPAAAAHYFARYPVQCTLRRRRVTCDQCVAVRINGLVCHEHGCVNQRAGRS